MFFPTCTKSACRRGLVSRMRSLSRLCGTSTLVPRPAFGRENSVQLLEGCYLFGIVPLFAVCMLCIVAACSAVTFHGLAVHVLRRSSPNLGVSSIPPRMHSYATTMHFFTLLETGAVRNLASMIASRFRTRVAT